MFGKSQNKSKENVETWVNPVELVGYTGKSLVYKQVTLHLNQNSAERKNTWNLILKQNCCGINKRNQSLKIIPRNLTQTK